MVRPSRALQLPLFQPKTAWRPPSELPSLKGRKRICIDVEGKDPNLEELGPGVRRGDGYICGLGLAFEEGERFYFPTRHEGGDNLDERMIKRWAKHELENFDGEVIGANLIYDLDWLAGDESKGGWNIQLKNARGFHDPQIAEPLLDEWRLSYSLEDISLDYLGEGKDETFLREVGHAYGWKTHKALKSNLWRLSGHDVGTYGEGDVDRPLRIMPLQLKRLEEEDQLKIYEIERQLIPILLDIKRRGVRVDLRRAEEVRAKLARLRDRWLHEVRRLSTPKAELLQPDSFAAALEARGLPVPRTPKTNQPSIKKEFFERYKGDALVDAIAAGRRVNTLITTFFDGHILGHHVNGRIHCNFNQLKGENGGTIARFSSSDPNLQNIPARESMFDELIGFDDGDDVVKLVRGCFLPDEGDLWQRDDYSQIEYRLLVHFAVGPGAEEARQRYNDDPKTDYHKMCAEIMGVDPEDKIKRKRVKNVNFAKGYGAGPDKLALMLNCSLAEANAFIEEYERMLPFTVKTYDKAGEWANRRGFVETVLGRKARFPFWEPRGNFGKMKQPKMTRERALEKYGPGIVRADTYKALNRKLQGSGADILKKAMVDAKRAGVFDVIGAILLTVHDENGTSIPRTREGDEAGKELTRIMERAVTLKVPVMVESERGDTWGAVS